MAFFKLFGKKDKIKVTFVNAFDESIIGTSMMPPDRLPESFEAPTTMHLKEEDWSVEEAIPVTAAEFKETGELTLRMLKVEKMDPKELLYSIPTISNELPGTFRANYIDGQPYEISEDDWRQLEFLKPSALPKIEQECEAINQLKAEHSVPLDNFTAFKECHVRDIIGEPGLKVSLNDLLVLLEQSTADRLKLRDDQGWVKNGFSITTPHSVYFGLEENGKISDLCLGDPTEGTSEEIHRIVHHFDLVFVNWYHAQVVTKES